MDPAFNMQRLTKHLLKFYEIADSIAEAVVAAQKDDPGGYIDINLITLLYTAGNSLNFVVHCSTLY